MDSAVKAFKEDLEWERKSKVQYSQVAVGKGSNMSSKYGGKGDYYEMEMLLIKKVVWFFVIVCFYRMDLFGVWLILMVLCDIHIHLDID